ncbi:MAG: hydantoinase/oxoprolinase family protein [Chloroflexota bacterium]
MGLRLGVDVGGTNTDAVLVDANSRLVAKFKTATTPDVSTGVGYAVDGILRAASASEVTCAMLGTSQCTNAIIERRRLNRVGILRIGSPATTSVSPLQGWPRDLREALGNHAFIAAGGHEFDGTEITALDEREVAAFFRRIKGTVEAIAVTGVFSAINSAHEERVAEIAQGELGPSVAVSLSSAIGSIGLLERENATILNAALSTVATGAAKAFRQALVKRGIQAALFLSQNDGTLMSIDYALRYPIRTIASGPANSIRGAAQLSGLKDTLVLDVGGTSSDMGLLQHGFARESSLGTIIGGVRTNFRMPDLISLGLAGGSLVHQEDGRCRIGPESVGYELEKQATVFGGDKLTLTDVAVAAGRATIGDPRRAAGISRILIDRVYGQMVSTIQESITRMKTTSPALPMVVVGGGAVLLPDRFEDISEVHRPRDYEVANAVGAAIAECSGEADRIFDMNKVGRETALAVTIQLAKQEAVRAGAAARTVEVLDIQEVPLAYLPGAPTRVRVRAAGPLAGAGSARVSVLVGHPVSQDGDPGTAPRSYQKTRGFEADRESPTTSMGSGDGMGGML